MMLTPSQAGFAFVVAQTVFLFYDTSLASVFWWGIYGMFFGRINAVISGKATFEDITSRILKDILMLVAIAAVLDVAFANSNIVLDTLDAIDAIDTMYAIDDTDALDAVLLKREEAIFVSWSVALVATQTLEFACWSARVPFEDASLGEIRLALSIFQICASLEAEVYCCKLAFATGLSLAIFCFTVF